MPKTDTLDALDNAILTILTTNKLWKVLEKAGKEKDLVRYVLAINSEIWRLTKEH